MRLARLVAAGLALGALSGFLAAFLRPRSAQTYGQHLVDEQPDDHPDEPGAADDPEPSPTHALQQRTAMDATPPNGSPAIRLALVAAGTVA
jgi:hypothetical protein